MKSKLLLVVLVLALSIPAHSEPALPDTTKSESQFEFIPVTLDTITDLGTIVTIRTIIKVDKGTGRSWKFVSFSGKNGRVEGWVEIQEQNTKPQ